MARCGYYYYEEEERGGKDLPVDVGGRDGSTLVVVVVRVVRSQGGKKEMERIN